MRSAVALVRLVLLLAVVCVLLPPAVLFRLPGLVGGAGGRRLSMRVGAFLQGLWARASLRIMGVRLDVAGPPPRQRHLIVANHIGYLDILVLAALFPGRFVAMHEIARWPLLGWMARSAGTLFVNRERKRDVLAVGPEMEATLANGVSVVLFPEGSAGAGNEVRAFKTPLFEGAVRNAIPCLAVSLHYSTPRDPWAPAWTVCWWGGMNLWLHLWRFLKLRGVTARVRWSAEAVTAADRKHLAQELRERLVAAFTPIPLVPEPPGNPWAGMTP